MVSGGDALIFIKNHNISSAKIRSSQKQCLRMSSTPNADATNAHQDNHGCILCRKVAPIT